MEIVTYTFTAREMMLLPSTMPPEVSIANRLKKEGFQFHPLLESENRSNTEPKPLHPIYVNVSPITNEATYTQHIPG